MVGLATLGVPGFQFLDPVFWGSEASILNSSDFATVTLSTSMCLALSLFLQLICWLASANLLHAGRPS